MFVGAARFTILSDAVTAWKAIWNSSGEPKAKNEIVVRRGLWRDLRVRQDGSMHSSRSISVNLRLLLSTTR